MATANLTRCLEEILRREGGYVDHPADPGGATNMGITRKTLARWRQVSPWWALPKSEVKALRQSEAKSIYKASYWDRIHANQLPSGFDLALFDYAVNSGPSRAVKALQGELKVLRDGIIGPITLRALKLRIASESVDALIRTICGQRLTFLQRLAAFTVFGRGWTRRVREIEKAALAMAGADPDTPSNPSRRPPMDLFSGYKTYIMALLMLLTGVAQAMGLDVPGFDGHSAGQLIMEALAVIFLRKGLKSDISNA